jgi:hypothetical protein
MTSTTDNVKLGVCSVLFDGVNLGFTKGGVEVEVATMTHEVKVDQLGETPIGELITGRTVTATVPLAETTLENMARIMPGSEFTTDGVKATGTVTLVTAAPVNGDRIIIAGETFTFRTNPTLDGDVKIGAGAGAAALNASAANLAEAINTSNIGYIATVTNAVVTLTSKATGASWNKPVTASFTTPANATVTAISGGVNATFARVMVSTGININLASIAKQLVLRPRGTFGEDDFIITRAATAGALSFSYVVDNERVYQAVFKGYAASNGGLFQVGK